MDGRAVADLGNVIVGVANQFDLDDIMDLQKSGRSDRKR